MQDIEKRKAILKKSLVEAKINPDPLGCIVNSYRKYNPHASINRDDVRGVSYWTGIDRDELRAIRFKRPLDQESCKKILLKCISVKDR